MSISSLFFRMDSIADRTPTVTLIGVDKSTAELVDHRQVARIRDDDDEVLPSRRYGTNP